MKATSTQVELFGGAAHEVVHADGAAVGERERQVGAGDQDARFACGGAARKDGDAAIGQREKEVLRIGHGSARSAAQRDGGGGWERAFAEDQAAQGLGPEPAEYSGIPDGARDEA